MAPRKVHQVETTNRKNLLHQEPSAINQKLIRSSLRALLPKGEEGLYAREEGVNERTAEFLLIEFQTIARIENISQMVCLKKLKLSNNVISEISGLDTLVNLTHLDLAYNCIKKIQNLDKLTKLELLNLHRNFITTIENIDNQLRLEYFIISSNGLNIAENVKYLRRFPRLRMLVIQANPCCDSPNFRHFLLGCLPELIVLDYERIPLAEKMGAMDRNALKLAKFSTIETNARRASIAEAEAEQKATYSKAYVDGFYEDELWKSLYQDDVPGQVILQIGEIEEIRATYRELFRRASMELFKKGMKAFKLREDEYKAFNIGMKEAKDVVKLKGQKLTEEFNDWGSLVVREMRNIVLALDDIDRNRTVNTSAADEHTPMALLDANKGQSLEKQAQEETLHKLALEYTRKLNHLWYTMMTDLVELNEQIEDVGQELGRSIRELVVGWLEEVRGHFSQLRDVQLQYHGRLVESLITYGDFRASDTTIPEHLKALLADKEALAAIVQQSHEHHGAVIDQKEEMLVANLKNWLESATNNIQADENGRSNRRICELSHYVDTQYAQLHKFKILRYIRGYVPELRADQDKIPKKWRNKQLTRGSKGEKSKSKTDAGKSDADEDEDEGGEESIEEEEGEVGRKPRKLKGKKKAKQGMQRAKSPKKKGKQKAKSPNEKASQPKQKKPKKTPIK